MSVQVWFAQDELVVHPGTAASLSLAIENVGDRTETFTIIPAGLTAGWTTVTRPNVTLFAGSRDVIEVVVRPPAIHSTSAGPTSLSVRVVPQSDPDEVTVTETIVSVAPFDDRRIVMLQPLQRGRRRATYEFMVDNRGNNLANCRLHLVDASGRVDGTFDPPAVGVAPGSSSLVQLRLRAGHGFFRRVERQIDFEIEASEASHEPALGRAALIQPPTFPARSALKALGWALGALAVVAAWYGVVRPELRDAADRAVAERLAEIEADRADTDVTIVESATPTTTPTDDTVAESQVVGTPTSYRIDVDAGVTQERSESVTVQPDSTFCLTDTVIQNPNADLGTAQLLHNSDVIYTWDLATVAGNQFEPRITCLPFQPSDNIVLSVRCDAVGDTAGTGCQVAVLLTGLLTPADLTPA